MRSGRSCFQRILPPYPTHRREATKHRFQLIVGCNVYRIHSTSRSGGAFRLKLPFCAGVFEGSFAKKLVSFFRTAHFPKGIAVFTWPLFFCCGQGVRFFHLQEEFLPASARSLIFRIRRMFFPRSVRTCFYGFAFSCPQEAKCAGPAAGLLPKTDRITTFLSCIIVSLKKSFVNPKFVTVIICSEISYTLTQNMFDFKEVCTWLRSRIPFTI